MISACSLSNPDVMYCNNGDEDADALADGDASDIKLSLYVSEVDAPRVVQTLRTLGFVVGNPVAW
jgi:hypothetical protein